MTAHKAMGEEKQEIHEVIMKILDVGEETNDYFIFMNALMNVLGRSCIDNEMTRERFLETCGTMYDLQKADRME